MADDFSLKNLPYYAIILGVGILIASIMASVSSDLEKTQTNSISNYWNNSLTFKNNSEISLTYNIASLTDVTLWCNTSLVKAGGTLFHNYTVSTTGVTLYNQSPSTEQDPDFGSCNLNFTYRYYYGSAERNLTGIAKGGMAKFANWFTTIGLILGVIILIGVIYGYMVPLTKR